MRAGSASTGVIYVQRNGQTQEQITRHLQKAIENLQREALKVEIWAAALHGFARPIPDYEPNNDNLLPRQARSRNGNGNGHAHAHGRHRR